MTLLLWCVVFLSSSSWFLDISFVSVLCLMWPVACGLWPLVLVSVLCDDLLLFASSSCVCCRWLLFVVCRIIIIILLSSPNSPFVPNCGEAGGRREKGQRVCHGHGLRLC